MIYNKKELFHKLIHLYRASKPYNTSDELTKLKLALRLAAKSLENKFRENGEPLLFHALQVAQICVEEIHLNATSIISILIHEAHRNGNYDIKNINIEFGTEVEKIVLGLNKISAIDAKTNHLQADNFRQLVVSFASDPRVILIKLADRLDVMRHLFLFSPEKQLKKSDETIFLYAPLAHKLGLYRIKSELEDLALRYSQPEAYKQIISDLESTSSQRETYIQKFVEPLKFALLNTGLDFEIKSRTKSIFSLWNKLKKKGLTLDDIFDVFAIRIILKCELKNEKLDCWRAFSVVSELYQSNPERLKDWISVPKSNGYESLHATVVGPEGKWVEVQIRTKRMDEVAENGIAAHWLYKGVKQEQGLDDWLSDLRNLLESTENPSDVVENLKLDLYQKEIFVFTPTGDLRKLPAGATVMDFAFDIHSNLGAKCIGGKINKKLVSIKDKLKNGDLVEIITSKNQKPVADWLNVVVTSKAKNKIRQCLKEDETQVANLGKEILDRKLKNWKLSFDNEDINFVLKKLKLESLLQFYAGIANDTIDTNKIKDLIEASHLHVNELVNNFSAPVNTPKIEGANSLVIDERLANIEYKLAKCCNPIFGDEIFGFVSIQEGIKIHRINCPNALQLKTMYPYRIVNSEWRKSEESSAFQCFVKIIAENEMDIFNKVTDIISKELKLNIRSAGFDIKNNLLEINIKLLIQNTKHLDMLVYRIMKEKGVLKVNRIE